MAFWVFGKPAPENTFFLEEHLVDAPEAAEGETADNDGQDIVLDEQGKCAKDKAGHQPDPPALFPPLVLHLDDQGMTDADAQEHGRADEDATEIHTDFFTVANIGKRNGTF